MARPVHIRASQMTSKESPPTFGVVVLNWNNAHDTVPCLDSLYEANPRPRHVVVVDNGSTDSSVADIRRWGHQRHVVERNGVLPWLIIIEAGTNRGFAGGNNLGIELLDTQTSVSHMMLLNNDAIVAPDFFEEISSALEKQPNAERCTVTASTCRNRTILYQLISSRAARW
jgi:GT2 family glycosyltransferase